MDTNNKCKEIYRKLCDRPEFIDNLKTGEFKNLERFCIQFKRQDGMMEILSNVHFCLSHEEFLVNRQPHWFHVQKGEYEKIVDELYKALL